MTNEQRKRWLLENGFEYSYTDEEDIVYEKSETFSRSPLSSPNTLLLEVHVPLNENDKLFAELHAGFLAFGSERCDSPCAAVGQVMRELTHTIDSLKNAAKKLMPTMNRRD